MLLFVLIAVFLAGLMIGRTPEYLGKKLQAREVQLLVATLLVMPVGVLVLGAIAASLPGPAGRSATPVRTVSASCCTPTPRHRQQRLGLRRLRRQHPVPQPDDRPGHADRPLRLHPAGTGPGRQPGGEESAPQGQNSFPTHGPLFTGLLP
jgi:K+-transporting ATPase ATPase A chain